MDLTLDLNKDHSSLRGFNSWCHQNPDACVLHDHPNPRVELGDQVFGVFVHGGQHVVVWAISPDPALTGYISFDFHRQPSIGDTCESRLD